METGHDELRWAPDDRAAPSAEAMERVLTLTARQNAYSRSGLSLWKQNTLHRKRQRSEEDGMNDAFSGMDSDQVGAAALSVATGIHQLVQSSGFDYAVTAPPAREEIVPFPLSSSAVLGQASAGPVRASAAHDVAPATAESPAPSTTARAATGMPAPHAPVSSLAKLVARVKAQQPTTGSAPTTAITDASRHTTTVATAASPAGTTSARTASKAARGVSDADDEEEDFGVVVPGVSPASTTALSGDEGTAASATMKHPSQMTREEYLSQFKRAPRRGEIGQDADAILAAEKLGYVMSGSRSKASQMYVDRIQRQLHEREAAKLQQQFRKVEDERQDDHLINGLLNLLASKRKHSQ